MMQMAKPMPVERGAMGKLSLSLCPAWGWWCFIGLLVVFHRAGGSVWSAAGSRSPLKMGQMCFQMGMAPVLWNCPRASSM